MSVSVELKAKVGDIVYVPMPNLPLPARREVVEVRMRKSLTTYALQNNRTGEIEFYDDIDFGIKVFADRKAAEAVLEGTRNV
jgi:hypothetical protein